ncbi:hypothetical protein B0T18DRAFT_426371 [Schizothecium vesticola]|uniref:Uncharacterized protein n=1 Tax=Schizothecium vesticola TaxID=314040 RepID=A0AA40F5Y3_9PEZI|nr:hypothetical protein B0T18DRAFT_426371 [Schizothecium vesticola]
MDEICEAHLSTEKNFDFDYGPADKSAEEVEKALCGTERHKRACNPCRHLRGDWNHPGRALGRPDAPVVKSRQVSRHYILERYFPGLLDFLHNKGLAAPLHNDEAAEEDVGELRKRTLAREALDADDNEHEMKEMWEETVYWEEGTPVVDWGVEEAVEETAIEHWEGVGSSREALNGPFAVSRVPPSRRWSFWWERYQQGDIATYEVR